MRANQLNGFYKMAAFAFNEFMGTFKKGHIYLNKSAAGKIKKDVKGLQKLDIAPKLKN